MSGPTIRFSRPSIHLATLEVESNETNLDAVRRAENILHSKFKSGTCGICVMRLFSRNVTGLGPMPTVLEEEWKTYGAFLSSISQIIQSCEIDIAPTL